jgi:hypothetical protein
MLGTAAQWTEIKYQDPVTLCKRCILHRHCWAVPSRKLIGTFPTPHLGHSIFECELLTGTWSAEGTMASGPVSRTDSAEHMDMTARR